MTNSHKPFDPLQLAYQPKAKKRFALAPYRKLIGIVLVVLIAGAIGGRVYFLLQPKPKPAENPEVIAQRQAQMAEQKKRTDLISTVGKQINLPTDEEPILATVSDKNSLQNQEFFQDAKNGDRILLYPKNKKAFLYRPSTKQVLATAPLKYLPNGSGSEDATDSAEITQPPAEAAPVVKKPIPTEPLHGKILIQKQH